MIEDWVCGDLGAVGGWAGGYRMHAHIIAENSAVCQRASGAS